jgi:L-asparaginase
MAGAGQPPPPFAAQLDQYAIVPRVTARVLATSLLLALVTAEAPAAAQASAAKQVPRVRRVATGGTISNRQGGRLTHEDLVKSVPNLERYARVESEQFANVASSQISLDQWLQLARRINELFSRDPDLAGVVVTSGTDTLEEVAYFLNLTVRDARPVVVVGSMRNPSTLGYEGAANLLEGFRVAADPASRTKGVLVVLNDEINAAREVTKTDALRLHTFQTRGYGLLGVVDSDRVAYYRDVLRRHTVKSEFDISSLAALPRVDVVMVYQGAPGDLIKAAVDLGARGIVLATAGAGSTSGTQRDGIRYATDKGVFVVSSTRAGAGRIPARPPSRPRDDAVETEEAQRDEQRRRYTLGAEDLAPDKARILLMLALTKTQDPAEIQRIFTEY